MKRYTGFLSLALLLTIVACQEHKEDSCCSKPENRAGSTATTASTVAATAPAALTDMSLYILASDWQSQAGTALKLEELQGRVQLVAMIYTNCSYACPRIIADLKRIENSLEQYKREDVGIVLVSMDPTRDTPEKLQQFATANRLDPKRWVLLTSGQDNIRELAALLNMKYKTELDGEISHSNIITVLNPAGEIVHQQEGLGIDPDETVKSIKGLLQRI